MMKQKVLLISILTSLALMGCGSDHDDNQNTAKMLRQLAENETAKTSTADSGVDDIGSANAQ